MNIFFSVTEEIKHFTDIVGPVCHSSFLYSIVRNANFSMAYFAGGGSTAVNKFAEDADSDITKAIEIISNM